MTNGALRFLQVMELDDTPSFHCKSMSWEEGTHVHDIIVTSGRVCEGLALTKAIYPREKPLKIRPFSSKRGFPIWLGFIFFVYG